MSRQLTESQPTRWALLGASDIAASRVMPAIRANGGQITIVQSGDPVWAAAYAASHGLDNHTTVVAEAVERADVDAVYVSSQNHKHHDQVITAAKAGKHVLAEKPLALSLAEAKAMVGACDEAGVVIATNHHLPASPVHLAMKALVAAGEIGTVRAVHVNHAVGLPDRLRGWRVNDPVGGGVILDVFIHDMAAVAAILGGQAQAVLALRRQAADSPAAPDSVMSVVEWSDEVIVQTHDAYDNYDLPTSVELLGETGAIRAHNAMTGDPVGEVTVYRDGETQTIDIADRSDLYLTAVAHFERAIRTGTEPLVTGIDGLRSLAAALAATESLSTGTLTPVEQIPG